jgi:hypothetical protein
MNYVEQKDFLKRIRWQLLYLCRPFMIFEGCLIRTQSATVTYPPIPLLTNNLSYAMLPLYKKLPLYYQSNFKLLRNENFYPMYCTSLEYLSYLYPILELTNLLESYIYMSKNVTLTNFKSNLLSKYI